MSSSKFIMNLVFACLAVLLALTAISSIYFRADNTGNHPLSADVSSGATQQINPTAGSATNQLAELERLTTEHPENAEYQTQLANLLYDAAQYEKASVHYQESLKIRPQDPYVETDLATCYHYLGQNDKALEILNQVLKSNPDFSQAKFNKGIVLINGLKDLKNGIPIWKDLLRSDPGFSQKEDLEQRIRRVESSNK
jgi:tetratricopeptide (TPR) repeat protein